MQGEDTHINVISQLIPSIDSQHEELGNEMTSKQSTALGKVTRLPHLGSRVTRAVKFLLVSKINLASKRKSKINRRRVRSHRASCLLPFASRLLYCFLFCG